MICATQLSQAETGLDFVERSWKYPVKFGRSRHKGWKYGFITACWETLTITIHEENQSNGELSEWKTWSLNDIVGVNVVKVKLVTSTDRSEDVILTPYDSSEGGLVEFEAAYECLYGVNQLYSQFCPSYEAKTREKHSAQARQTHLTWWPSVQRWMHDSPEIYETLVSR